MALCNLGGPLNIKFLGSYSEFKNSQSFMLKPNGNNIPGISRAASVVSLRQKTTCNFAPTRRSWRCLTPFVVSCSSSQLQSQSEKLYGENKVASETTEAIPSSQVESLLTSICDTSSIAEFKLNFGGFKLYVKRDIGGHNATSLPPTPTPVQSDIPTSNGSPAPSSLALSRPEPSSAGIQRLNDDDASDEGLVMLHSPKVGLFRRSRTIKGKRVPPPCKEKQEVKEGQVLCYIEQLGGEIPIESDVSGEVVKILRVDGEPLGYGDTLIAILPSFPGIKKLQLPA